MSSRSIAESSYQRTMKFVDKIGNLDLRREAERSLAPVDNLNRQVTVFHQVYGLPIVKPDQVRIDFGHITKQRLAMRFGLIVEEFMELCEAMDMRADINFLFQNEEGEWVYAKSVKGYQAEEAIAANTSLPTGVIHYGDNVFDLDHNAIPDEEMHVIVRERLQEAILETDERSIVDVADACADLKYVIQGFELEVGIPSGPVLAEVQCSNLSKLGADGNPIYRSDGKVLKGPGYFKADIHGVLRAWGMQLGTAPSSTRI